MDLIRDFKSANEFNNYDITKINFDYFEKKGLILNFQKVIFIIFIKFLFLVVW